MSNPPAEALSVLHQALKARGASREGDELRLSCPCGTHDDNRPSFYYNIETGAYYCHGCGECGSYLGLGEILQVDLAPTNGSAPSAPPKNAAAVYQYHDERGYLLYEVIRTHDKQFRQRRPYNGAWAWGLKAGKYTQWSNGDYGKVKKPEDEIGAVELPGQPFVPYRLHKIVKAAREGALVYLVEGEKDVHSIEALGLNATWGKKNSGLEKWLKGADVVILPDNDEPGRKYAKEAAALLSGVTRCRVVPLPVSAEGGDPTDWIESLKAQGKTKEDIALELGKIAGGSKPFVSPEEREKWSTPLSIGEWLSLEIPPPVILMEPWLIAETATMVYGPRGVGKTYFGLGLAMSLGAGIPFLGWNCSERVPVAYFDAEMPAWAVEGRMREVLAGLGLDAEAHEPDMRLLSSTLRYSKIGETIPDLATPEGQGFIEDHIGNARVTILDNLSTLVKSGDENTAESWQTIQDWIFRLRGQGVAVIFFHHSGKGGDQRGTSRREDILDTVIKLEKAEEREVPAGVDGLGLVFRATLSKGRHLTGPDCTPKIVWGEIEKGVRASFRWQRAGQVNDDAIIAARRNDPNTTVRQLAEMTGMSKSAVGRRLYELERQGEL